MLSISMLQLVKFDEKKAIDGKMMPSNHPRFYNELITDLSRIAKEHEIEQEHRTSLVNKETERLENIKNIKEKESVAQNNYQNQQDKINERKQKDQKIVRQDQQQSIKKLSKFLDKKASVDKRLFFDKLACNQQEKMKEHNTKKQEKVKTSPKKQNTETGDNGLLSSLILLIIGSLSALIYSYCC